MPVDRSQLQLIDKIQIPYGQNTKCTMTIKEALQLTEATLKSTTGKELTYLEKEILKAAWNNETYSKVADTLRLSHGHIKDVASVLWHRLSDAFGEKIAKNNFRQVIQALSSTPNYIEETISENDTHQASDFKGGILIVDDLTENLRFLTNLLIKHGYKVRSAPNGKMALKTIRNNPPDLILLDIIMPEMDGYQVCQALKADKETSEIPVIFLSGIDEGSEKTKAFEVGGLDYITKPFYPQELIARLQTQLNIQQQKQQLKKDLEKSKERLETIYQLLAFEEFIKEL